MTAVAAATAPRTSPTVHTVRRLAAALVSLGRWFWAIVVVVVVLANVVGWLVRGSTDVSIAVYARQASTWFPFSLAVMLVAAYLRVHVASGMTRRTFVRAAVLVEVAAALVYAAALTALVLAERAVHDALGWDSVITEIQLTDAAAPPWALFLDLTVPFVLANLSGLLVGAVYLRGGAWWGTLTLPLTVGPVAASLFVPGLRLMEVPGYWTTGSDAQVIALAVGLSAVLAAVTALAFSLVARSAPITAKP